MTIVGFFAMLHEHGIRRARLVEYLGELEVYLPWFGDHAAFKAEVEYSRPVAVQVTYKRLAFWRCWFRPYQHVNMMHLGWRRL